VDIKLHEATISLTETTVRELYNNMIEFKKNNPDEKRCLIQTVFSEFGFDITMEATPHTQESLGFKISTDY